MAPPAATALYDAERLAHSQPPLKLAALRIAASLNPGIHGLRRAGSGDSFWQFRHYQPGDAARQIDWRRSARSDPVFVRENEWEAAQSVWLWRDASPSMHYRSLRGLPEKAEHATLLLLATAALLLRGAEHVAILGSGQRPSRGASTLDQMAARLARPTGEADSDLPPQAVLPRHAQLILISDFLAPLDAIGQALRPFAAAGVRGHMLQVLDPAETSLPMRGRIRFEGLEGEGDVLVRRVDGVRQAYQARLSAQQLGLTQLSQRFGWTFAIHRTDRPPQTALLALHAALALRPDR
jgi:uncharacterized protein (DUF58 family)